MKYLFASVRGEDFEAEGDSPLDAYMNLEDRERDEGTLWRLNDLYRNKMAVQQQGFKRLKEGDKSYWGPMYKEKIP